ncbi:MAG: DUF1284 domain-containing protein [Ruminococcus sp.]|nr:DUF1284 domain-containing protein [Ruminococcus sp.]
MQSSEIRPHHALCTAFFEGKGYSGEFVRNMAAVKERLASEDPEVRLTAGWDMICRGCPHSQGTCGEKAVRYDRAVLEICGLPEGQIIRWSRLSRLVHEKIITAGKLPQVCGDCRWSYICSEKCK